MHSAYCLRGPVGILITAIAYGIWYEQYQYLADPYYAMLMIVASVSVFCPHVNAQRVYLIIKIVYNVWLILQWGVAIV